MAKRLKSSKRPPQRASSTQRILQVFGVIIAVSMILVLLAPLAGGSATLRPLPTATASPTATPEPDLAPTPGTSD